MAAKLSPSISKAEPKKLNSSLPVRSLNYFRLAKATLWHVRWQWISGDSQGLLRSVVLTIGAFHSLIQSVLFGQSGLEDLKFKLPARSAVDSSLQQLTFSSTDTLAILHSWLMNLPFDELKSYTNIELLRNSRPGSSSRPPSSFTEHFSGSLPNIRLGLNGGWPFHPIVRRYLQAKWEDTDWAPGQIVRPN